MALHFGHGPIRFHSPWFSCTQTLVLQHVRILPLLLVSNKSYRPKQICCNANDFERYIKRCKNFCYLANGINKCWFFVLLSLSHGHSVTIQCCSKDLIWRTQLSLSPSLIATARWANSGIGASVSTSSRLSNLNAHKSDYTRNRSIVTGDMSDVTSEFGTTAISGKWPLMALCSM